MRLNVVFHDIVKGRSDLKNEFSVTLDYYLSLVAKIERVITEKQAEFSKACFYFDNGHRSFGDLVFPLIKDNFKKYCLAITTDNIDQKGYLGISDLAVFKNVGIRIASHGCSHAALAIYDASGLQATPDGGPVLKRRMSRSTEREEKNSAVELRIK